MFLWQPHSLCTVTGFHGRALFSSVQIWRRSLAKDTPVNCCQAWKKLCCDLGVDARSILSIKLEKVLLSYKTIFSFRLHRRRLHRRRQGQSFWKIQIWMQLTWDPWQRKLHHWKRECNLQKRQQPTQKTDCKVKPGLRPRSQRGTSASHFSAEYWSILSGDWKIR